MLARFTYYTSLALRDLVRLWSSTQHHVLIVAGICLPILLLLGLKRGHVEELRRELMTSPTGRQLVFWSSREGLLLDAAGIETLQASLPGAELMIPDQQRVVSAPRPSGEPLSITLYSTRKGDPILGQYNADVLLANEHALVLPDNVADALGKGVGDAVDVTVRREVNGQDETAVVAFTVKAIYTAGGGKSEIGYADSGVLSAIERFVRGYAVPEFGLGAAPVPVADTYSTYLYLFEKGQSLSRDDQEYLTNRGLQTEEIDTEKPWELFDFVRPESRARLQALRIVSRSSRSDPSRRLDFSPSEMAEILSIPDDVAIAWNAPLDVVLDGKNVTFVGLSLPRRSWLRGDLVAETLAVPYDAPAIGVTWPYRSALAGDTSALRVVDGHDLALPQSALGLARPTTSPATAAADPQPAPSEPETAIVPTDFLAQLTSLRHGLALYDPQTTLITPAPAPVIYDKVRLFARTIDDVPTLAERLYDAKFAVQSEDDRIQEIHEQDSSLQLLVSVVGLGVFLFGILTVISVLVDSTDRKRGTLGILRVMGVSKLGVVWIVVLRAAIIGFLAGCLSAVFGQMLATFLGWPAPADSFMAGWKPTVHISLTSPDVLLVFFGALVCASVGAIYPAIRASRIDPFDAIVEGRFR